MFVYPPGYGRSTLASDYRPWEDDQAFLACWRQVRDNTLVDPARLYELWELVAETATVRGEILEVGAWRGGSGALISRRATDLGLTKRVYIADTFSGVAKAGDQDEYYRGGEHADTSLDIISTFFQYLGLENHRFLVGVFPDDTATQIEAERFSFCHIDVDVYRSAADVFDWVWSRMPRGGVCVFDDYGFLGCEGVTRFVHEIRGRRDLIVVANANGHAVVVRTSDDHEV